MNITQSSVSLFFFSFLFCLGFCQLGLRYFTENMNSVFLPAVFSILEGVHLLKFSITCVLFSLFFFVFVFGFFVCLFPFVSSKGQAWVFDFRDRYLVRFLSQNYHLNLKNSAAKPL